MTKGEAAILARIAYVPWPHMQLTDETVILFSEVLHRLSYLQGYEALIRILSTDREFPPTPGMILENHRLQTVADARKGSGGKFKYVEHSPEKKAAYRKVLQELNAKIISKIGKGPLSDEDRGEIEFTKANLIEECRRIKETIA